MNLHVDGNIATWDIFIANCFDMMNGLSVMLQHTSLSGYSCRWHVTNIATWDIFIANCFDMMNGLSVMLQHTSLLGYSHECIVTQKLNQSFPD